MPKIEVVKIEKLEELQSVTIDKLLDFFKGPSAIRESKVGVRFAQMAISSLAVVGRIKATERARDATQLTVLRMIASDEKQMEQYLKVSMPHMIPMKQVENKKK